MQYFHLEQPLHELVLCDRNDCEAIADYLEVADDGTEYRRCSFIRAASNARPASPHAYPM